MPTPEEIPAGAMACRAAQNQTWPGLPPDPGERMAGKVLTGNGITRCERGSCPLVGGEELASRKG